MAKEANLASILEQMSRLMEAQSIAQKALLEQLAKPKDNEFFMETLSKTLPEFSYDPQNGVVFDKWYARHQEVFTKGGAALDEVDRVRLLLQKLNSVDHDRYVNFILPRTPKQVSFADTVKILTEMFGHQTSVFFRRFQCLQTRKRDCDDFVTYASTVNKACEDFSINTITVDQFKCLIFVAGLHSEKNKDIRTRLLVKMEGETAADPMTLKKLLLECQQMDNLKHDTAVIENPKAVTFAVCDAVQNNEVRSNRTPNWTSEKKKQTTSKTPRRPCWQCGQMHFVADCSYTTHTCRSCGNVGHKEGYCGCFSKPGESAAPVSRQYHPAEKGRKLSPRRKPINSSIQRLGHPEKRSTDLKVSTASGKPLPLDSEFECQVTLNETTKRSVCYVTPVKGFNVFGSDLMDLFGLYDVPINAFCKLVSSEAESEAYANALKAKFPAVFQEGLGLCTKTKVHLFLQPGVTPVFKPRRPVPFHSQRLVEKELQRLQNLGVIEPVEFSNWAAPIVAVRKAQRDAEGDPVIRVCADYSTGLNAALEANKFPLPTPDDIFAKLAGSQYFSVLDLSDAYLQMEVDEDSQKLLTVNTHKGLFKYKRLPPGVKSAPGAFQKVIDNMIGDLEGTESLLDDVIVFGKTRAEHDRNLNNTLQRIQEFGFRLKLEKCKFGVTQVKYLGHIISRDGLRTDPEKVRAILQMPPPKNVTELRSFLGAINYYSKFMKEMHLLRKPLDDLLQKDKKWVWTDECQRSFVRFKDLLQSDLMLTHYNPKLQIVVAADASNTGIGATIRHRFPDGTEKVIQHAARSLTPTERAYGQIDKEALALVYAVTKFHRMLLGWPFILETDHQPLLRIFGSHKGIPTHTSNRLQRFALTMLCYDFKIEYVSTTKFGYADVLSRLISSAAKPEEDYIIASVKLEEDLLAVLEQSVNNTPVTARMIATGTKQNRVLNQVLQNIECGWPSEVNDPEIKAFYNRKESLTVVQGCILFGDRVVVPQLYQNRILQRLHHGHPGIVRMKSLARSFVFWPGIDGQIEAFVKQCKNCASVAKSPAHAAPEAWPTPSGPWQRLHIDFAGPIDGLWFLIIVDAFSRWPEIYPTKTTTAKATIQFLRNTFARLGLPLTIVSDNAPQFTCDEFESFCKTNGIVHLLTAPYHPQSNGQAERFVDSMKRALKKINKGEPLQETLDVFLATYRSTPCGSTGQKSPSEMMFGRQMRTTLDLLRPVSKSTHMFESGKLSNIKQPRQFNVGDLVYAKVHKGNDWYWEAGKVIERIGTVNYNVWLSGQRCGLIRSHVNQLRHRHVAMNQNENEVYSTNAPLPLSVLLDEFNIGPRPTVNEPRALAQPEQVELQDQQQPVPGPDQESPQRAAVGSRIPVATTSRGRPVRLPPRFEHYVMS
ncbi:uncharacterized protein K02A2.6-like [Aedes albopictus]|uniref:RNA-directed DNA polymerase n=1 Tax=Aedes albopictus TaxID=7160 RepID=A0ABM1ZT51_AEDAL